MSNLEESGVYQDDDHRASYIFCPLDGSAKVKRRKVGSEKNSETQAPHEPSGFVPLFRGAEKAAAVLCRQQLFEANWSRVNDRIQNVLRKANQITLEEVNSFVQTSSDVATKIPAAFIVTGPNIASQDLLFEQLSEKLHEACQGRFVRIRSGEAPNLKAALKKIVRDATARDPESEDDFELAMGGDGRKYLDYDLQALYTFIKPHGSHRVILAFEDSEAFDSGLVSDLVALFSSWRNRIQFALLFGIATSVDLFQARLLRSTCQQLYGCQFDVAQRASLLDSLVRRAVASADTTISIGPTLLRSLIERQSEQVAGIQSSISSLKYAYMCHFYANPLSIFVLNEKQLKKDDMVQPEHLESIRSLPSFRRYVELSMEFGERGKALQLLEDDEFLKKEAIRHVLKRQKWAVQLLRSLHLTLASGIAKESFTELYTAAFARGSGQSSETDRPLADAIERMSPAEVVAVIDRLLAALREGDEDLALEPWHKEEELSGNFVRHLSDTAHRIQRLASLAQDKGTQLRSKYTAQSTVLRTTVVARKVQLSRDSAALTEEDKLFTDEVDKLAQRITEFTACLGAETLFMNEVWLYDSRAPYKDVFMARPGAAIARALSRPHDYLASQGSADDSTTPPATAVLYRLYLEAGALVNVADLWSAFYGVVGEGCEDEDEEASGVDERTGLVLFYRALAELKALGFVKASRKKTDHIAKVKWL